MDKGGLRLDKIDRYWNPAMRTTSPFDPSPAVRKRLLATRITGSRYIFPNLAPSPDAEWELALGGREECASDYLVSRDRYPFHVVEYVAAGSGKVRLGRGREHEIGPGSVFSYAPDMKCWMRTDPAKPLTKFFFALAGSGVAKRLSEARLPAGAVRRFVVPSEVITIAEDIIHEGQRHSTHAKAICLKLVELMLLKVAGGTRRAGKGDERARENFLRCRALIEAHADSLCSLGDISSALEMDGASVCRLFRRFQGTSPYQYLLRRKMALAAEHLVESCTLVRIAAERVGFADPYHFARCFKKVHGVTPSEVRRYRTNHLEGPPKMTQ